MQRFTHIALALLVPITLSAAAFGSASAHISAPPPNPPDATHPYVMQATARTVATARTGALKPFVRPTASAAVGGAGGPTREVFGFALASSLADPTIGYPTWNFDLLTTVAFFGLHVNSNGQLANDSGYATWSSSSLTNLVSLAHQHGAKVVLTVILQDFSPNTP